MSEQDKQPTVDPVLWRKALAKRRREEKDQATLPQPGGPVLSGTAEKWTLEDEFPEPQKDSKTPQECLSPPVSEVSDLLTPEELAALKAQH